MSKASDTMAREIFIAAYAAFLGRHGPSAAHMQLDTLAKNAFDAAAAFENAAAGQVATRDD